MGHVDFRDLRNASLIIGLWVVAAILINPLGEFSIGDDWAYRQSVQAFVDHGQIFLSDWLAANLFSHLVWGCVFGALFGTSASALRVSSVVAGLVTGIALYRLLRLNRTEPGVALLATMTLLFNPLFLTLAFSFMSDVSYTAMQTVAMWLIAAGTLKSSALTRAGGWLFGAAALLNRQTGFAVALGVGGERVLRARFGWRAILAATVPVLVFFAIQFGYQTWLAETGRTPLLYGTQVARVRDTMTLTPVFLVVKMLEMLVYQFFYLGLFALPLSVTLARHWTREWSVGQRRAGGLAGIVASVAIAILVTLFWRPFPMWADFMTATGFSPGLPTEPAPRWLSFGVTVLAAMGGVLLCLGAVRVGLYLRATWHERRFAVMWLVLLVGSAYNAAVFLVINGWDRYLTPLLPCVFVVLAGTALGASVNRRSFRIGWVTLAMLSFASICGVHDTMEGKRTQLAAYQALVRTVPATRINAGWVVAGAAGFARYGTRDLCCWFDREDYIVITADAPKPGFRVIGRYPVRRWLPWQWGRSPVLVQQRVTR